MSCNCDAGGRLGRNGQPTPVLPGGPGTTPLGAPIATPGSQLLARTGGMAAAAAAGELMPLIGFAATVTPHV